MEGCGLVVTWPAQTKHVLPVAARTLPVPFWFFWATVRTIQSLRLWKRRKISKMPRAKQSARRKKFDYNRNRKNVKTKNKKKSNPRIEQWVLACVLILVELMQKHVIKAAAKTYQWPESRLIDWSSTLIHLCLKLIDPICSRNVPFSRVFYTFNTSIWPWTEYLSWNQLFDVRGWMYRGPLKPHLLFLMQLFEWYTDGWWKWSLVTVTGTKMSFYVK